jgi:hypothetical protein
MFNWLISGFMIGYFLNSDCCNQSLIIIKSSYKRIGELRKLKQKMNITVSFKMFFVLCWVLWTSFMLMLSQWLNKNIEQIGKNKYLVTFVIGGKKYSTIIKHEIGPSPILQVVDNNDNDITQIVEPYLLFNSTEITPGEIGYDNISIMNHDGTDVEYNKNDTIKF